MHVPLRDDEHRALPPTFKQAPFGNQNKNTSTTKHLYDLVNLRKIRYAKRKLAGGRGGVPERQARYPSTVLLAYRQCVTDHLDGSVFHVVF